MQLSSDEKLCRRYRREAFGTPRCRNILENVCASSDNAQEFYDPPGLRLLDRFARRILAEQAGFEWQSFFFFTTPARRVLAWKIVTREIDSKSFVNLTIGSRVARPIKRRSRRNAWPKRVCERGREESGRVEGTGTNKRLFGSYLNAEGWSERDWKVGAILGAASGAIKPEFLRSFVSSEQLETKSRPGK